MPEGRGLQTRVHIKLDSQIRFKLDSRESNHILLKPNNIYGTVLKQSPNIVEKASGSTGKAPKHNRITAVP